MCSGAHHSPVPCPQPPAHPLQPAEFEMPAKCIFTPAEDELLAAGIKK